MSWGFLFKSLFTTPSYEYKKILQYGASFSGAGAHIDVEKL